MRKCRILCVILSLACILCGCSSNHYENYDLGYVVYQVTEDGMSIKTTEYDMKAEDPVAMVMEFLKKYPALDVRDFQLKEKHLSLYLSSTYHNLKGIDEVLLRAAVVKTLCQVPGVEYVEFFVDDVSLIVDGVTIGVMSDLSFLDSIGGDGYTQDKYVTLYFADATGTKVREVTAKLTYDMTVPLARLLVEELIQGPKELEDINTSDVRETIPKGTVVNSLTIRDNVCYVDFSKEFSDVQEGVSSDVVIFSIVNTLCELSNVNKVQFTIGGEQRENYGDTKHFDMPFERDLDLVKGGSKG